MSMLINAYYSLLVDVRKLTGIQLDLPDDLTMSWVLISAPALDKQLLVWLESGGNPPVFPEWLKPLWEETISYYINSSPDVDLSGPQDLPRNRLNPVCLRALRTLLVFGYKAEFEPTNEQLQNAQNAFEDANQGVGVWNETFKQSLNRTPMFREARRLVSRVVSPVDWENITPSHGPGAVYPSRIPCEKGKFQVYDSINAIYPYDKYFNMLPSLGYDDLTCRLPQEHSDTPKRNIVCRMVAVPKDSRGPRLISVHPAESVWIQQGQRNVLERAIERNPLTSGKINFTN
jgi:hypothetical protein